MRQIALSLGLPDNAIHMLPPGHLATVRQHQLDQAYFAMFVDTEAFNEAQPLPVVASLINNMDLFPVMAKAWLQDLCTVDELLALQRKLMRKANEG